MVCPPCPKLSKVIFKHNDIDKNGLCLSKHPNNCLNDEDYVSQECEKRLASGETLTQKDIEELKKYGNQSSYSIAPIEYPGMRRPIILNECDDSGGNYSQYDCPNNDPVELTVDNVSPQTQGTTQPSSTNIPINIHPCEDEECNDQSDQEHLGKGMGHKCWIQSPLGIRPGPKCHVGSMNCWTSSDDAPICGASGGDYPNCWKKIDGNCDVSFGVKPNNWNCFDKKLKCQKYYNLGLWKR